MALAVGTALLVQVVLTLSASGATGLLRWSSYFTVQSNLLVLGACATLAVRPDRDGPAWRVLRLDALLGITITGVVYATLLAPDVQLQGVDRWIDAVEHYGAPAATLAGWLLFGPRPRLDRRTLLLAFAWPLAWVVWTFAHGALTGWYPYPFLDAAAIGYPAALAATGTVLVAGVLLAALLRAVEPRLPRR
ncbi:Pr6Pr family membrane protein [Paenibacillus sp. TRM 82003]|uniref:Pr6Pr family membrane protein n=1 Tax=Kineococcus sp. TRM81007 TaxID=2925831 RepID=UPI001F58F6E4|nr:Pr6Pr family membrane protein [Kineococcus sp. TRM81007]MCI2239372.1 Pr6Pr family membrane protein [Kineococcus sp. TRM81007]MCI3925054.1 Pr6Pr family membrane protein [Paenibacillus sp. TRM 82003]